MGAMMITHILDPVPTEAHVHCSLWADTPMYVSTEGLVVVMRYRPVIAKGAAACGSCPGLY